MTGIIGIDLGTTSSSVAVYRDGRPTVITTGDGAYIPSLVTFNRNGEPSVGYRAQRRAAVNPSDAVFSVKRLLGRSPEDPVVQRVRSRQSFTVQHAEGGNVEILTPSSGRPYTPQEIASLILRHLKQEAEAYLGSSVRRAVLAVPAHFNDSQRQSAREAGRLAGLDILRVINEPTAAALAYGNRHSDKRRVLVIDLGGGHYDVSLLEIQGGSVTVYASDGDSDLGGEEWDAAIADYLAAEFLKIHGSDLKRDEHASYRLRSAAEEARKQLSEADQASIHLPFITSGLAGPKHLEMTLTRSRFASETADLNARLAQPIERVIADARKMGATVDHVLLIGGSAHMPALQEIVRDVVGDVPIELSGARHLVALGAALQAGQLAGDLHDVALRDVTPLSLGLETMGGLMTPIILRNTPIPVKRSEVFSTIGDNQTEVEIHVLQGERSMASDNSKLGVFHLRGIPAAPRGVPQIEVTFEVDADGILHVAARDMASGSTHALTVTTGETLAQTDIQRLVEEAASCEAEDLAKRSLIEAQNLGRQIIYQTERCLQHLNGLNEKAACVRKQEEIRTRLDALQQAIDAGEISEIRKQTAEIQQASSILHHLIYGDSAPQIDSSRYDGKGDLKQSRHTEIVVEKL